MDEQVRGPFKRWHHAHTFEAAHDGEATLMGDVIDFAAPAGPLGRLAEVLVLRRYMAGLILTRNAHLKELAER